MSLERGVYRAGNNVVSASRIEISNYPGLRRTGSRGHYEAINSVHVEPSPSPRQAACLRAAGTYYECLFYFQYGYCSAGLLELELERRGGAGPARGVPRQPALGLGFYCGVYTLFYGVVLRSF